jgi:hypothetical protein
MGSIFGFEKMQFPPLEKLNANQVEMLVNELLALWKAFNFYPDFPDGLPNAIKYKLLVDYIGHKTSYVTHGDMHIEFCSYMPEECPFPPEFCQCKQFIDDNGVEDIDLKDIDFENPF